MRGIAFPVILATVAFAVTGCERQPTDVTAAESLRFAKGTPTLKVDQSNTVSDQLGLGNGLYGQTFVPGAHNLAVVDIVAIINNVPAPGVETTLGLFTDITQPPIATTTTFVAAPAPGELERTIRFAFDPAVPLIKGASYTIGLYAPADVSWEFAFGDPYPPGQVVLYDGTPLNPTADFVFTTYASKK